MNDELIAETPLLEVLQGLPPSARREAAIALDDAAAHLLCSVHCELQHCSQTELQALINRIAADRLAGDDVATVRSLAIAAIYRLLCGYSQAVNGGEDSK